MGRAWVYVCPWSLLYCYVAVQNQRRNPQLASISALALAFGFVIILSSGLSFN